MHICYITIIFTLVSCANAAKLNIKSLVSEEFSQIFGPIANIDKLKQVLQHVTYNKYIKYLMLYNKIYTGNEKFERFDSFKDNVKSIVKSKIGYLENRSSYSGGINQFTDEVSVMYSLILFFEIKCLIYESFIPSILTTCIQHKRKTLTTYISQSQFKNQMFFSVNLTSQQQSTLPKEQDWRHSSCVSIARNQGKCGSCYSFATISLFETMRCLESKSYAKI